LFVTVILVLFFAKLLAAGLATTAISGAGVGIGILFSGFLIALTEAPELEQVLFSYTLLGFALIEAIALFGLMMAFVFLFGV
jgi:F-type H+-transporting ATPase subunit c